MHASKLNTEKLINISNSMLVDNLQIRTNLETIQIKFTSPQIHKENASLSLLICSGINVPVTLIMLFLQNYETIAKNQSRLQITKIDRF